MVILLFVSMFSVNSTSKQILWVCYGINQDKSNDMLRTVWDAGFMLNSKCNDYYHSNLTDVYLFCGTLSTVNLSKFMRFTMLYQFWNRWWFVDLIFIIAHSSSKLYISIEQFHEDIYNSQRYIPQNLIYSLYMRKPVKSFPRNRLPTNTKPYW